MGGAPAPSPMGGASTVPPADPNMGGGMPPMDDPNAMGGDPMGDPSMEGNGELDPTMAPEGDMGGDPSMGDAPEGEMDDLTRRVVDTMKNLTDKDKETISAYADSLRDSSENAEENAPEGEMPTDGVAQDGGAPVMETVIFKKGQLRRLNENLLTTEPEDDKEKKDGPEKKKGKGVSNKSPFKSPKFN